MSARNAGREWSRVRFMFVMRAWFRTCASAAALASGGAASFSRGGIRGMAERLRAKGQRPSESRVELERGEEVGVTSSQNSAGGHVTREVPLPPGGREIVIHHLSGPGARMEHPIVADIDS